MKEIFPRIFLIDNKMVVENFVPGYKPFDEEVLTVQGKEFRVWSPLRSKAGAAIQRNIASFPILEGSKVLYLGIAHGYTSSFLSSVVGTSGVIYGVEFSERCFTELLPMCDKYKNIIPIMADARKPEEYAWIEKVSVVYIDIAQPDETEIFIRNCREFLKEDGYGMIAVKSRSIDVTKSPNTVYREAIKKLEDSGFEIIDWKTLDPYERAHCFIVVKFKS
jgi:fibrillarin-like pre-rRNA processing protein